MRQKNSGLTPEQIYKNNQFKAKVIGKLSPIIFYMFLGLSIMFFALMIKSSVGNITQIITLLDSENLTGIEVQENYEYLIEKWGEWTIIGSDGGVISVQFVNIKNAFFSGLMVTFLVLGIVSLVIAILVGKVILPKLIKYYTDSNQSLVDIATLKTHAEIMGKKKNKIKEDWF